MGGIPGPTIPPPRIDLDLVARFADLVVDRLGAAREEIDALNVYPIPDGDTGTNMYLTVASARDELRAVPEPVPPADDAVALATALNAYARGALLGARGNSGVILSQLLGAFVRTLLRAAPDTPRGEVIAASAQAATDAAYEAVGRPVEGTMLSVARASSQAATAAARAGAEVAAVLDTAVAAADEALARTPDQLQILKDAGVVDAGGRGLCVVLEAARTVVTGWTDPEPPRPGPTIPIVTSVPTGDLTADGPAYEVMYLLHADDDAVAGLRATLQRLGDSLVVVGGDGLWNVHVHVDDVGAAVEAGIVAGRPSRIRVTHFAEQITRASEQVSPQAPMPPRSPRSPRSVVAVAAGPGLATVFADAGARVIPGGPGRRPSTADFVAAITETGAAEVVVLPNDPDSLKVAEIAAQVVEEDNGGTHVVVIPTRAQVQGIAAIAVHEPGRAFDADVVQMTAAAQATRHGAVTIAAKRAMTMAGPCEPGDALGVIQGDFAVLGGDLTEVAHEVLERLLGGGGELVTLVSGRGGAAVARACKQWVAANRPEVDVEIHDGGQERYPLLIAVE